MSAPSASERWHALDALRAMAMLWVVVGHAFLAYIDTRYGRMWAVYDRSTSEVLTVLFWWIHGFRLPLFFLLAGLFAARLHATRGPAAFLRHRTRRIALPFAVGAVVLLPIIFYVFAAGWWISGECTWNEIRRVRFGPHIQPDVYGPVHLWFLEYLYLYCLGFWAWRHASSRWNLGRSGRNLDAGLASPLRPLLCALPTAIVLFADPGVVTTHRNSFVPVPLEFLHYGIFFAIGVACFRVRDLERLGRGWPFALVLAQLVFWLAAYPSVRSHFAGAMPASGRALLASSFALYAWLSAFGLIGAFQALFARPRERLSYLADAAYWIYLVHLPLVAALQIALAGVPAPAEIKCAAVVALTLWACLRSYERWVRYTFIGTALNGKRERPRAVVAPARAAFPIPRIAQGAGAGPA